MLSIPKHEYCIQETKNGLSKIETKAKEEHITTPIEKKNRLYGTKLTTLEIVLRDTSMQRIMQMGGTK
jgi:hypothetical protein